MSVSNSNIHSIFGSYNFYSYLTQRFIQLYSQLIFTQTKIVTNEGTSDNGLKFKCNSILFKLLLETPIDPWTVMITSLDD